jgi:hypothetical protein
MDRYDDQLAADERAVVADRAARAAAPSDQLAVARADRAASIRNADAPSSPARSGAFADEMVDGYRWDAVTRSWVFVGGVTRTAPTFDGTFADQTVDGYRWDVPSHSWVAHVGIDRTDSANVPEGFTHTGDGSAAHPHDVRAVASW